MVYEGENRTISEIRTLISEVRSSNAGLTEEDPKYIELIVPTLPTVKSTEKYKVTLKYSDTGYINYILVEKQLD